MSNSSGATCWICFENDDSGPPLVRDCACRGDAGFVHLSCIINYAETKSKQINHRIDKGAVKLWYECPTCLQGYDNQLGVDISSAFVSFTIETFPCHPDINSDEFPCDPYRYLEALTGKVKSLNTDSRNQSYRQEISTIGEEILSIIEKIRNIPEHVIALSMVSAFGFYAPKRIDRIEYITHKDLGGVAHNNARNGPEEETEENIELALKHLNKYRELAEKTGDYDAEDAELNLDMHDRFWYQAGYQEATTTRVSIDYLRNQYKQNPSPSTGSQLAKRLLDTCHTIEGLRLMDVLIKDTRRTYGPDHSLTKSFENEMHNRMSKRLVALKSDLEVYQVIRYEDDGTKCLIKGPNPDNANEEDQKSFQVGKDDFVLFHGTPVICYGLNNAKHLNGKIGETRDYDEEIERYKVHFEDEGLKPCLVKSENVRILFDVPPKE